MENYGETGLFWLPTNAGDQVVGELIFDMREGVSLRLHRTFGNTWPESPTLIVGVAGAQEVTLLDPYETSHPVFMVPDRISTQVFHANRLLLGHAFDRQEDVKFTAAGVSYYGLAEWVNRSDVEEDSIMSEDGMHDSVTLRYNQPEAMSARFGQGVISIRFPWGLRNGLEELTLTHAPSVYFEYDDALEYGEILEYIKYIQDFITLCTDRAITPTKVTFYNRNIPVRMLDGSTRGQQPIEYRASPITSPTFAMKSKPQFPLNHLVYDAVGGVETIAKWVQAATKYAPAVNPMTSFRSEMKSFVENRFLNVAAAAEAFHHLKHPEETRAQEAEWDQLQNLMLSAIPEEHREWLSKELPYINQPILSRRLTLLGKETKAVTGSLSGNSRAKIDRWAGTIAAVRNELTHRRSTDDTFPGEVLHWLAESVYQVLRVCLLKECITNDIFDRLAASPGRPEQLATFVTDAMTEAREIVRRRRGREGTAYHEGMMGK